MSYYKTCPCCGTWSGSTQSDFRLEMAVCTGVYRHFIVPFYARDFFNPCGKPDTHRYTFSKLLRCNEFERVGFEAMKGEN